LTSKLCLHGVHIAHPESFAADVARLLQGRVIRGRLREKEYGEGKSARFRRSLLRERDGQFPCQIHLLEGILLAEGSLVALYDVEFAYEHGAERQVMELVDRLLSEENEYTLAEPDPALRLQTMVGRAYPPLAGRVRLNRAVRHYLAWQLMIINWFWYLLLSDRSNKVLVRQLRVKIRRLRSCLVFFKEGLPAETVYRWQSFFKAEAETLSNLRELDVALLACRQMSVSGAENAAVLPARLEGIFSGLRQDEENKLFLQNRLNDHTKNLAEFLLWLMYFTDSKQSVSARRYCGQRLLRWSGRLREISKKYPDFSNMENLHRIRIKVKRLRYVIQTVDLIRLPVGLLRQLKQLQDVLGLLHDGYVNGIWAKGVLQRYSDETLLAEQVHDFLTWQKARSEAALAIVPGTWKHFQKELGEALKKN